MNLTNQAIQTANVHERVYATWDCPQVKVRHAYKSQQEDELSLNEEDVINVTRKMSDG